MWDKICSYFYSDFVRKSYPYVYVGDDEEVYYHKNKLVVLVKNKEVGEQIYDIVKTLKDSQETICTHNMSFKIDRYFIGSKNRIQLFCVNLTLEKKWSELSKIRKLQELIDFIYCMETNGFILDDSKFESEKCNRICDFLSLFISSDKKAKNSKGYLIKHIHYVLSDGNLDEFYQRIISNNLICNISDFPYSLPVIKMCYDYFVTGYVPENIYEVLQNELRDNCYDNCLIANKNSFKSNFVVSEENDEYTIYDGNIKIYDNMYYKFGKFLQDYKDENDCVEDIRIRKHVAEKLNTIIIDFNGDVIGYKFLKEEIQDTHTIFDNKFESQCEILDFVSAMSNYLFNVLEISSKPNIRTFYPYIYSVEFRMYYEADERKKYFNIEESLIYRMEYPNKFSFNITNIEAMFELVSNDPNLLREQITTIFFKLYLLYLNQRYGEMRDEEQFLDKVEIRYLSAVLAREFINYALGREINYEVAEEELYKFLYSTKAYCDAEEYDFYYDSRVEYNPIYTPFIFESEAEKKYGIKIEREMSKTLSDERTLITFYECKKIFDVKSQEDYLRNEISKKLGYIESNHVKIAGISEIICSKDIGIDGMYKVIGYITDPIKGKPLKKILLDLSNKDFLKVAGYLLIKFDKYFIDWDSIWMDDDFVFYINILDERFRLIEWFEYAYESYVEREAFNYLTKKGYNSNAFIDVEFSCTGDHLIKLAESFDAYCDEHHIYYNGYKKACPICLRTKHFVPRNFEENTTKFFEDSYAKHYRIDNNYNLKIYKTSCVNMAEVEKNIDEILSNRLNNSTELEELGQDCFVPCKKVMREDSNQFIGCIYDADQFSNNELEINAYDDIKNSQKLKNLPRLMSLIRLILQIKKITKRDAGFIQNPFSHVFLSKDHKKQVQILNIEFLKKKGSVENTIKWTCEYVCETLTSDTSIEVDISDCSKDLDSILQKLQVLSQDMTKYCTIHKMYYRKHYSFCPKCMKNLELLELKEVKKFDITNKDKENEGGESVIYPYGTDSVAKVFKEEVNYELKVSVITKVLAKKEVLEGINEKSRKYKYIIPKKILVDEKSGKIFGYIMDRISNGMPICNLKDKSEVEKIGFTKKDVFEILIAVGQGIENLHANNIYIGDLNGRNILFDSDKNVYFLDFDGMGVDEITPEFCTDGYIDPKSKKDKNITMKDDWYSFAIQAFYYLTFTHPFNGIYSVEVNGEKKYLEIPDKMERRISLLGKHGMKAPTIAEPWDWMNRELKIAFLGIFEGNIRESIVSHLIRQYESLYLGDKPYDKSIRINPKFIATELKPFGRNLLHIINHYSAICENGQEYYISMPANHIEIALKHCLSISNILLSDDENIAFAVYEDEVIAIDLKTTNKIYDEKIFNPRDVVVNGRTLYFTGISEGENVIFQVDFMPNSDVKEQKISFLTNKKTKRLYVKFNSKFIIIKRASDNVDEIYCNSEKLCDMSYQSESSEYNIIYDDATALWLIVSSEGNGIIIKANGMYKKINIQESVNDMNIGNIVFNKGMIYIPNQECLHIVNTNDQMTTKKMECHKIMTPNSRLYDINTNGFSVITDQMLYEVRRG